MIWRTLYDIKDYDDFNDSLKIMEEAFDKTYDLIYLEAPPVLSPTLKVFTLLDNHLHLDPIFLKKCLENTYRLLKDDGILVFAVDKGSNTYRDCFLYLNQLFPSINDIICVSGEQPYTHMDALFFCSKQPDFLFPASHILPSEVNYAYSDEKGLYRLSSLITSAFLGENCNNRNFEWNGFTPGASAKWKWSVDRLDKLYAQGRIIIQDNWPYEKVYRTEEGLPEASLWETSETRRFNSKPCTSEIISKIFTLYCNPKSHVFCPFDYDGQFTATAIKHSLNWTSIRMHLTPKVNQCWNYPDITYKIQREIPWKLTERKYKENLLVNYYEVDGLKEQISELSAPKINIDTSLDSDDITKLPNLDREATGKKIRRLRIKNGYNVEEIVDLFSDAGVKISRTTVYNWESGKHFPTSKHLVILLALYKLASIDDIYVLTGPKKDKER